MDTIRISIVSAVLAVVLAYPIAWKIVRSGSGKTKRLLMIVLIVSFFMNSIVRVLALVYSLSPASPVNELASYLGLRIDFNLLGTESAVILGILNFVVPLAAMTLLGPVQNVNRFLEEAALSLGASEFQTFKDITLPLSMPGIIAALSLCFADGLSAFMCPALLGLGLRPMMSNSIFARYGETLNYPGGATLSIMLLAVAFAASYGFNAVLSASAKGVET